MTATLLLWSLALGFIGALATAWFLCRIGADADAERVEMLDGPSARSLTR